MLEYRAVNAYTDRFSYRAGQDVAISVASSAAAVTVELVRLDRALIGVTDATDDVVVPWDAAGEYPVTGRPACVGSFLVAPLAGPTELTDFTVGTFFWVARADTSPVQVLMSLVGGEGTEVALGLTEGRLALLTGRGGGLAIQARVDIDLRPNTWYLAVASVGEQGGRLRLIPCDPLYGRGGSAEITAPVGRIGAVTTVTAAGRHPAAVVRLGRVVRGRASDCFTGKLESPFIVRSAVAEGLLEALAAGTTGLKECLGDALVGGWDLSCLPGEDPNEVRSVVAGAEAAWAVNVPTRAVTGRSWTGRVDRYGDAPSEYAAIHFHRGDLADAGWPVVASIALPATLTSGLYGVRVSDLTTRDIVPIVVVPEPSQRGRLLVLLPVFSYLAYANEAMFAGGLVMDDLTNQRVSFGPDDLAHVGDLSYGLSMYDTHADGSGVAFSGIRRTILNMRRGYPWWLTGAGRGFSADMYLIEWLTGRGYEFDVITDLEVHEAGVAALHDYAVVLSGSHPEYTSERMLDALEDYRDAGGNLMYLGGNGWYWVTGVYSADPLVIEIRRGYSAVRCWESMPGEVTLVADGSIGGLWRHRGRAPQRLSGVGFCAQGWGHSEPYRRSAESYRPEVSWIFEGVAEDPIGGYGVVMGGAAGDELDRADPGLGTPPDAVVLASSFGHSNFYQRSIEELPMNLPGHGGGEQDPQVHSDLVYFATPAGGQVFSVGSIAWSGSLLTNGGVNGVSRITDNVLARFSRGPAAAPATLSEAGSA